MAAGWRQLRLLLWKDYLIRKRKLVTLFGVIWATLVVGTLWVVRMNVDNQYHQTCQYPARALPSAGMLTFLQSFICSIDNQCSPFAAHQDVPTYNNSRFTQLRKQFGPLIQNDTILDVAGSIPDALKLLSTMSRVVDEPTFIDITKNGLKVKDIFTNPDRVKRLVSKRLSLEDDTVAGIMEADISIQGIISGDLTKCSPKSMNRIFMVQRFGVLEQLVERICPISNEELQTILVDLLPHINISKYVTMIGNLWSNINGDDSVLALADASSAILRMSKLEHFVPSELQVLVSSDVNDQFHYYNLTIITKLVSLFQPWFGATESYISLRQITEGLVSVGQWLQKLFSKTHSPVLDASSLVLDHVGKNLGSFKELELQVRSVIDMMEEGFQSEASVAEVFDVLSKITNFIVKYLPKHTQHNVYLYGTLLSKLIEGAHRVVIDNVRLEDIVYNVSRRNEEAVKLLNRLPVQVISNMFDALTDAARIEILTSKITSPGKVFCDVSKLQSFLQVTKEIATATKSQLCSDVWTKYVSDLINSFGIFNVKKNIDTMASLLIQETLGKDISAQLYTIDKGFQILEAFTLDLLRMSSEARPRSLNFAELLNVDGDAPIMEAIRSKKHLGKLILITIHGAFAQEVVKQNIILELKLAPILIDVTNFIVALNTQLGAVPKDLVLSFQYNYVYILKTMLLTLLDEQKTLTSLSTYATDIFCNGMEHALHYLNFPDESHKDTILEVLCSTSRQIDVTLRANSTIGKAIKKIRTDPPNQADDIDWVKLINNLKDLYKNLQDDYPYIFNFTDYGVKEVDKVVVEKLLTDVKEYWFGRQNMARTIQLSIKFGFQLLDLIDGEIFNISNEAWLKFKYLVESTNGFLVLADQILKLFVDLNSNGNIVSDLPESTVVAMKHVVPNIPRLLMDVTNIIMADNTDIQKISNLMNESPPWPCSNTSISTHLALTPNSVDAVRGMETIFCMDTGFQRQWLDYIQLQRLKLNMSITQLNTTQYAPHLFLKFSLHFGSFINHVTSFKSIMDAILNDNSTEIENPTIMAAWRFVTGVFRNEGGEIKLRIFLNKVDTVFNSIQTSPSIDVPLHSLWKTYIQCSNGTVLNDNCRSVMRSTWENMLKFISVIFEQGAMDLLQYFTEINDPNANLLQTIGFTKSTGLYILYDKLPDLAGVLLNSYWDYGFMNQIRRASKSEFWDCEAVVDALVIPPGSQVSYEELRKLKPYVCPSLLHWISLPREENAFLNIIAKPQYYFYSIPAENLTSVFESTYVTIKNLSGLIQDFTKNNLTNLNETAMSLNTIEDKFDEVINNIITWKITNEDASYRLFNEINKKQFISTIYLTRITIIVNKIFKVIDNLNIDNINYENKTKLANDLSIVQKIFKRRPSEAIAIHFDIITEMITNTNEKEFNIINAIKNMCNNVNTNVTKDILNEGKRVKNQICSKEYNIIYDNITLNEDFNIAKNSLLNLVNNLQDDVNKTDVFAFFNNRKELLNSLKLSIKYADDLSLPIYLKYLDSNLRHYDVIVSFLSGADWWSDLKKVYAGPNAKLFFEMMENSVDIAENILTHLDKIHLVRLIRDININNSEAFCQDNLTLSDYIPDSTGLLSRIKSQICHVDRTQLFGELPPLVIVSQGYDSELKLSKDLDYEAINKHISTLENKLETIKDGPKPPMTPSWITQQKLQKLKMAAVNLFSKETLTTVTFGVLSNIVDGSILFLNNTHCPLCSTFTTWFKQLNLQLFKKQEYDNLLCSMSKMTRYDIYYTLKNDFHWDMALKELISTRNYTRLELNKSINEFLDQLKLHILDDLTATSTKLSRCLAHNVTHNEFGNASLFLSVLSHSLQLVEAVLPHIKDIDGIKEVPFLKQLSNDVAPKLHVKRLLKDIVNFTVTDLTEEMLSSYADLYLLHQNPNSTITSWLTLRKSNWSNVCDSVNCTLLDYNVKKGINRTWIKNELKSQQIQEFWHLKFITNIIHHVSVLISHAARICGVGSQLALSGVLEGRREAVADFVVNIAREDNLNTVVYSLQGIVSELQPLLEDTPLYKDLCSLSRGLEVVQTIVRHFVQGGELNIKVSTIFGRPERLESALTGLGINNTNFWSLAAPRIHTGHIDFKPLLTSKEPIRIRDYVCQPDYMAKVVKPSDLDVVTLDDVCGAVIEQFCGLPDERVKIILPVILENLNFSYVFDQVVKIVLKEVYHASNLTAEDGAAVIDKFPAMMSLLPTVQGSVANLTDSLAKEPLFEALKDFNSIGGLLSSSNFLASAGNMLCGKPFEGNGNRFYKTIAETKDFDTAVDPLQLEALPTEFCRDLYKDVLSMGGGKIVWSFVKPLLMGRILYTPPTKTVVNIIQQANSSFSQMSKMADIVHKFAASFSSLQQLSEHRRGVAVFKDVLTSEAFTQLRGSLFGGESGGSVDAPELDLDEIFNNFGDLNDIGGLLRKASSLLRCIYLNRFHPASDEAGLAHEAVKLTRVNEFSAGIVFTNITQHNDLPISVSYKIRMDIDSVPTTTRIRNQFWTPGPEGSFLEDMRYFRGFVQIQDLIDKAIIATTAPSRSKRETQDDGDWAVYTQQIPYPCYLRDYFQSSLYESQAVIVAFFFAFIMTVSSAVRFIVSEKETGNTMLMCIMGVRTNVSRGSWVLASLAEMVLTVSAVVLVLCAGGVLPRSDAVLLWMLICNYGVGLVMFCYMISKFFKSASVAAVCACVMLLCSFMPYVIILSLEATLSTIQKFFTMTSMSTAFCYSMLLVGRFEAIGVGAQWSNVWQSPDKNDAVSIAVSALMVMFDSLLYLAIGCIIEKYFGIKQTSSSITISKTSTEKAGVSIVNVTKVYGDRTRSPKVALDNVSVELHRGQITTLLGQNGAGKTTLIKIITGMMKPTKGGIVIRVTGDSDQKTRLGVCPQNDVLFDNLTTREHLTLYHQLKCGGNQVTDEGEVDTMLQVLSLGQLAHQQVSKLSGGMRRRVCVSLAFLGNPQLVLLDEPSSGVDPVARRDIWSLIIKLREQRTVLLTTHHLDEAELLSDQIVILHKGQIHTIGSPVEIKRSLGNGYKLTVTYPEKIRQNLQDMDQISPWEDDQSEDQTVSIEERSKTLLGVVRMGVKNAQLVDVCGLEVEFLLPFFDVNGLNNNFLDVCSMLEDKRLELGYLTMSMDCSGLEQVMANVTDPNTQEYPTIVANDNVPSKSGSSSSLREDSTPLVPPEGPLRGTYWQQYCALLLKRWKHYTRNRWLLFLLLVLPSLFVTVSMGFSLIRPPYDNEVSLQLHPDLYQNSAKFAVAPNSESPEDLSNAVMNEIFNKYAPVSTWSSKDTPRCNCTDIRQECNFTNYNETVPQLLMLPDSDTLNDWLVGSQEFYIEKRYGGFSSTKSDNTTNLIAWYNNKGHHAMPSFISAINSATLRAKSGHPGASITTYTHPLKISHEQLSKSTLLQHVADVGIAGMLLLAYSLIPAAAAVYIVQERVSQHKRLQLLSAVPPSVYWGATVTWDIMIIIINVVVTSCVLLCFGLPVFVDRDNLSAICVLLLLFGFACNSVTHLIEKLFTDASVANMVLFCGNVFAGASGLAILLILDIISESDSTDNARWVLHKIFLSLPQFALGDALVEIAKNTVQAQVLSRFGMDTYASPLTSPLLHHHFTALILVGVLLTVVNLTVEYHCFDWILLWWNKKSIDEDDDEMENVEVTNERRRVHSALATPLRIHTIGGINAGYVDTEGLEHKGSPRPVNPAQDAAACVDLSKAYGVAGRKKYAVKKLTLGIPAGQCTALLGENGAGKSTTFGMLTGAILPSSGEVVINHTVRRSRYRGDGLVSYCPQNDAIDPLLTVRETLQFYCAIRGLDDQHEVIKRTLSMFDLGKYAEVQSHRLSGGNKRKLCTAVAFMGRSTLILLDEPTSGMDPLSRMCVTRAVSRSSLAGRGVLLSTHAPREIRGVATRQAFLRGGRLAGIGVGSVSGYIVQCSGSDAWRSVRRHMPHARPRTVHTRCIQFSVPTLCTVGGKEIRTELSDIFRMMAQLQGECDIEDYTVSESSMDQMFENFSESVELDDAELEPLSETWSTLQRKRQDSDTVTAL